MRAQEAWFVYASQFPEQFEDARGYGWTVPEASFDWPTLLAAKDKEIARLEGIYRAGVDKAGRRHVRVPRQPSGCSYDPARRREPHCDGGDILVATAGGRTGMSRCRT